MSVIENFNALSEEELLNFAEALVKTINSERILSSDTSFTVYEVEADELSGDLIICLDPEDPFEVDLAATWSCATEEDIYDKPNDAYVEYDDYIVDAVKKTFKTQSTEIDGYKVSLDIEEVYDDKIIDTHVDEYSQQDAGYGHYDYFGFEGDDSRPYIEVTGTITKSCSCSVFLYVSAADAADSEE